MNSKLGNHLLLWFFSAVATFSALTPPPALNAQTDPGPARIYFAHFAVGMGFATTVTLVNTGNTQARGSLLLRDPDGNPGNPTQVVINPGGINTLRLEGSTIRTGWATYEGEGGNVTGVSTFEYAERGGVLKSIAGVVASSPVQAATIPVEYDPALSLEAAYGIANPGTEPINITMKLFSDDGFLLADPISFTLPPNQQIARYVHQDFTSLDSFRGTVVFSASGGGQFLLMSLAQNKGLYTVMPVIPNATGL